ncbi:MAG TPA: Holliday junction resolvase RuvX [Candidatus Chromulinivoraceae bacterium]|nr:Holliday junction resolvase RuvX [Candidatus Chromulinivoraceae bacterium]
MSHKKSILSLDVGEKRIGVAVGNTAIRIAMPIDTLEVDGTELERIAQLVVNEDVDTIVVGYPRNQSGEPTAQTRFAEAFAKQLVDMVPHLKFQDESLTSVLAEQQLKSYGKPYAKGDIDAVAASLILQDYLEAN